MTRNERMANLGRRINEEMLAKGWKRQDLAQAVGLDVSTITRVILGQHITTAVLFRIAEALEVEPADLLMEKKYGQNRRDLGTAIYQALFRLKQGGLWDLSDGQADGPRHGHRGTGPSLPSRYGLVFDGLFLLGDHYHKLAAGAERGSEAELIARKKREAVHECQAILLDAALIGANKNSERRFRHE